MSAVIDFYFDFPSPYAYLGSRMMEVVAAKYGRTVQLYSLYVGFKAKKS